MTHPRTITCAAVAAVLLSSPAAFGQLRGFTKITATAEPHLDPQISPDGSTIAFRGSGKIGSVGFLGGPEGAMAVGNNLGDFVWSPNSSGIYYMDGVDLTFVAKSGGNGLRLTALPGQQHRLWCVDSQDNKVWGTRFEPSTNTYHIFTASTSGAASVDIVSSSTVLDQVRLDPSETRIVYREALPVPFAPAEVWSANADGTNPVSLTGGTVARSIDHLDWVDGGQTVAFTLQSQNTGQVQLGRLATAASSTSIDPLIDMLTEGFLTHRNMAVSADKEWLVHHCQYTASATSTTVAILPSTGGGRILLARDNKAYILHGPPTIDAANARIAFAASFPVSDGGVPAPPQIYTGSLDRELRIEPRAELGQSFSVTMPIATNEVGAVFIAAGEAPPLVLPGFAGGLAVNVPLTLMNGGSSSGELTAALAVPNITSLVGQVLFFQGLRVISLSQGDFTRLVDVQIF